MPSPTLPKPRISVVRDQAEIMGFRLCHARFSPMLRVMNEAANTVPVTILTGFLGSGKTTVLNHLLRQPSLADTVVIVNEFGAVGLDHLLIEQAIEDAVLLKNGCICCTVRGDIADTLDVLWQRREAGELPPFRRIAIETTGLADPGPGGACAAGRTWRTLRLPAGRHRHHGGCAARRDAARSAAGGAAAGGDGRPHPAHQDRSRQRRQQIAETDGAHRRVERHRAAAPGRRRRRRCRRRVRSRAGQRAAGTMAAAAGTAGHHGHQHLPFRHGDAIGSVVLRHDRPIAWAALQRWLESVLSLRGDSVLRLKGIVWLHGETRPIVLQGVHHVLHPPVYLDRRGAAGRGHAHRADHARPVGGRIARELRDGSRRGDTLNSRRRRVQARHASLASRRIPTADLDRHHRSPPGPLRAARSGRVRHRRYRIHARAHLLAGALRRAACRRTRGRGDRCAGAGDRSHPAR